ncbi:hypothetical protein [Helicobacter sp. 13S00477-4]|uniref:hypothetical protein n=1 Tax=Helicobacter sp. 13S00477-4 TaxID=1905759 RepID=UPI000BA6A85C|nr:hypothetical protein [Helicobacter sp. 13S00477-4]PAF50865.1 hypothetical protein BKH44_06875 [Helicobacter sp. 13S00477-4]
MNPTKLSEKIQTYLKIKGLKITPENKLFIDAITQCLIVHLQTEAIVEVKTTGTANAQSGIGKIY